MPGPYSDQFNPGVVQIATAIAAGSAELVALVDGMGRVCLLNGDAMVVAICTTPGLNWSL